MHSNLKKAGGAVMAIAMIGGLSLVGPRFAGAADLISAPPTEYAPTGTVTATSPGQITTFSGDLYVAQSVVGFTKVTPAGVMTNLSTDTGGAYAVVKTSAVALGQLFWVEGTNLRSYAINGTGTTYIPAVSASAASLLDVSGQLWIGRTAGVDRYTISGATLGPIATIPLGATSSARMALGTDGNVWIVETDPAAGGIDKVTRWTQAGGQIGATYLISNAAANPSSIARGTDGVMSITEPGVDKILRMNVDGAGNPGLVAEVALPVGANPQTIVAGPDNAVWFTQKNTNNIGRIADGASTASAINGLSTGFGPQGMALGADANIWVSGVNGNKVAKFGTAPVPTTTTVPVTTTVVATTVPATTVPATTVPVSVSTLATTTVPVTVATTTATTVPAPVISIIVTRVCVKTKTVMVRVGKKRVRRTTCLRYRNTTSH